MRCKCLTHSHFTIPQSQARCYPFLPIVFSRLHATRSCPRRRDGLGDLLLSYRRLGAAGGAHRAFLHASWLTNSAALANKKSLAPRSATCTAAIRAVIRHRRLGSPSQLCAVSIYRSASCVVLRVALLGYSFGAMSRIRTDGFLVCSQVHFLSAIIAYNLAEGAVLETDAITHASLSGRARHLAGSPSLCFQSAILFLTN